MINATNKPSVVYIDCGPIVEPGKRADVLLLIGWCRTSRVIAFTHTPDGPIIETMNTFYFPPMNGPDESYSEPDTKELNNDKPITAYYL